MVSEGCGDCANRLPKKVTTQSKMQTKRAIIKLNLHGTADYALAALEAAGAPLVGRPPPRATLSGTPGELNLTGPEFACVVTGLRPVQAGLRPRSGQAPPRFH